MTDPREHMEALRLNSVRRAEAARFVSPTITATGLESLFPNLTEEQKAGLIGEEVDGIMQFPFWQFDAEHGTRPDLPAIREALFRFSADPIVADRIMMESHQGELGGLSIWGALNSGETELVEIALIRLNNLGA